MNNLRKYGSAPFRVAVIHGGPGAPGEMAPVARELALTCGVLEPLQTADSIDLQVAELKSILEKEGTPPVTLVGFSWGAMLGFIVSARLPALVKKLIMVSSGPFTEKYAANLMPTRSSRLSTNEKEELLSLMESLDNPFTEDKDRIFARFGALMSRADSFKPFPHDNDILEFQYDIYQKIWAEARKMRMTGELLNLGKRIRCPVVAIHGDYDPHPADGVKVPLTGVLKDLPCASMFSGPPAAGMVARC